MFNILCNVYNFFISTPLFILITIIFSFIAKLYLLAILVPSGLRSSTIPKPWIFLIGVLFSSLFGDIAWITKLLPEVEWLDITYATFITWKRISWGFMIVQYQSLALFIESLCYKNFVLRTKHMFLFAVSSLFVLFFFYEAACDTNLLDPLSHGAALAANTCDAPLEIRIMRFTVFPLLPLLIVPELIGSFWHLYTTQLPTLLRQQLFLFLTFFICPYLVIEALQASHFVFDVFKTHMYPVVALATFLLIIAINYCIRKVIGLRFLQLDSKKPVPSNRFFIPHFKKALDHVGTITNISTLITFIKTFFYTMYGIESQRIILIIREQSNISTTTLISAHHMLEKTVEQFLLTMSPDISAFIYQQKILIYDDLDFSDFYQEHLSRTAVVAFLRHINAALFLPLYEKHTIIGYVIISRAHNSIYNNITHDALLFANYISSIMHLIRHEDPSLMVKTEQKLHAELEHKQQELNYYRDSVKTFLRTRPPKEVGIIFYTDGRFIPGNSIAKRLVGINLNVATIHPTIIACKSVVTMVINNNEPYTTTVPLSDNKQLIIYGVHNTQKNNVILTVYHQKISDKALQQLASLQDPTIWDYVLYLETTPSGKLLNKLIPNTHQPWVNFKIELLKAVQSKKALWLTAQDDSTHCIELLHTLSLRKKLHTLHITHTNKADIALQIFGINPLLESHKVTPLLSTLNTGTLCIHNIDLLDQQAQLHLAEYLGTGSYRMLKSKKIIQASTRIICSLSNQSEHKHLHPSLAHHLLPISFTIPHVDEPTPITQAIYTRSRTTNTYPTTMQELNTRLQELVHAQSSSLLHHTITEPALVAAAYLGKKALKNPDVMMMLWNKFKNQKTIATFLGVNRSSINRRCKEYDLK